MNEERERNVALAKFKKKRQAGIAALFTEDDIQKIHASVDDAFNQLKQAYESKNTEAIEIYKEQTLELVDSIKHLATTLNAGLEMSNINEITDAIKRITINNSFAPEVKLSPQIKVNSANIYDEYKAANSDYRDPANIYHGFVHPSGKWFIMWQSGSEVDSAYKFATGTDNYTRAWSNRKRGEYKRYDLVKL